MVLMDQKPIARAALATLAMAHQVQSGPVGPTAPPPELSSDIYESLLSADDPLMQQLSSLLSAQRTKNDDLEKRLAASEEKARIN